MDMTHILIGGFIFAAVIVGLGWYVERRKKITTNELVQFVMLRFEEIFQSHTAAVVEAVSNAVPAAPSVASTTAGNATPSYATVIIGDAGTGGGGGGGTSTKPAATDSTTLVNQEKPMPYIMPNRVQTDSMTPAQRDARAFAIGPGITQDLSNIAQTTGDQDVMRYASDIIYRQVDHPEESITDSIKFVRGARSGNSGSDVPALPTDGPIAQSAAVCNGLPGAEKARYFVDHPELAPYARTLFPDPNALNGYTMGNSSGTFNAATWDAAQGRYMVEGKFLSDAIG